ncbi:MAG: heat-inducible transcription repressor HrcA [Clostridia bacterium]|nr:heat-inducible transcription repressor HrcA [Clostridia bacterium]
MELGARKQQIVSAIVDAYIRTGEPIGSKALVCALEQAVSSATIRNDMADLAAAGFLAQPHTSAGRVPTAKAFRFYIDRLLACRPLSERKRAEIDTVLGTAAGDPEKLIAVASDLLARETGVAALAATPDQQQTAVRKIEVLCVGARSAAILLMTENGNLHSRVCRLDAVCDAAVLEQITACLNEQFAGKSLSDIGIAQAQRLLIQVGRFGLSYAPLLTAFVELVNESAQADVQLSGQLNLLQHPDYPVEQARSLLSLLSKREWLDGMLTAHPDGLRVVLGSESPRPELYGSCIIMTRYALGDHENGALGLIGPVRMDYAYAIPRLQYVAKSVGRLLTDLLEG